MIYYFWRAVCGRVYVGIGSDGMWISVELEDERCDLGGWYVERMREDGKKGGNVFAEWMGGRGRCGVDLNGSWDEGWCVKGGKGRGACVCGSERELRKRDVIAVETVWF